jgi:predicted MFS family arabinose efflux permease
MTEPDRSSLRLLQLTSFVSTLDRFAMPSVLLAISRDLSVPLPSVVAAASVYYVAYGAMQPVWGIVSDRLGRVRTLRITLLLAGITTAVSAGMQDIAGLTVARGIAGGLFGAAMPTCLIYVGDVVPIRQRQQEVTRLLVGVALGTALGAVGAGALAQVASWRLAFAVTGGCALVLSVLLRRLPEPAGRPRQHVLAPLRQVVATPVALLVLLLAFTEGVVLLGTLTLLPSAVESAGTGAALAGAVTAAYGLAVLAFAPQVGRLSRRWPTWWLIGIGGAAAVAGCATAALSQRAAVATVAAVLLGLAWAAMHSSLQTWATSVLPGARAAMVSLFAGALFAGSAVASAVVAGPAGDDRFGAIFGWLAALAVPLALLGAGGRARWHPPPDPLADRGLGAGRPGSVPAGGDAGN